MKRGGGLGLIRSRDPAKPSYMEQIEKSHTHREKERNESLFFF